jgi:hypothetical protein
MDRIGRECRNDRVWRAGWVAVAAARYVGNGVLGSVYESSRDPDSWGAAAGKAHPNAA